MGENYMQRLLSAAKGMVRDFGVQLVDELQMGWRKQSYQPQPWRWDFLHWDGWEDVFIWITSIPMMILGILAWLAAVIIAIAVIAAIIRFALSL
jgi:hypothetical protein